MKFTGTLKLIGIDRARFQRELEEELKTLLIKSATAWLNAALQPIPVWSGAARSTFSQLASSIGFQLLVNPKSTAPDRTGKGAASGTGDLRINTKGQSYFRYSTDLAHLIFNEFNANPAGDPNAFAPQRIGGTPYGFQEKGLAAWEQIARTAKLPIPRIRVTRQIRI